MGKVVKKVNHRVEVYPRKPGDFGVVIMSGDHAEDEKARQCEEIAQQIRKHVNGIPSRAADCYQGVRVIFDAEESCEHCGSAWTGNDQNNGGCCDGDMKDQPYLFRWCEQERGIISVYNGQYGDERICQCGHEYYRHFDTYENMYPVGCKYCECDEFKEQILTQEGE